MLFECISEDDYRRVIAKMLEDALGENVTARIAARGELLNRLLGKVLEADVIERMEAIEKSLSEIK